ncbi:MAG: hypothetical protein ACRDJN_21195 [Chloroflexota bacterium]
MAGLVPPPGDGRTPRTPPPDEEPLDDVDRVYARLAPLPPPRSFTADVMLAVRAAQAAPAYQPSRRPWLWVLAELAALVVLALLAFLAGQAFVGGGALDLLGALADNAEVVGAMPAVTLLALAEAFPWIELLGLLGMLAVLRFCTRRLSRALIDPAGPAPRAGAA